MSRWMMLSLKRASRAIATHTSTENAQVVRGLMKAVKVYYIVQCLLPVCLTKCLMELSDSVFFSAHGKIFLIYRLKL